MTAATVTVALTTLGIVLAPAAYAVPRCFGKRATIVGTGGRDVIKGTRRNDVIVTFRGRDKVNGRGGDDRICTGAGPDLIRGQKGADQINGGSGTDGLLGGRGNDRLVGGAAADVLIGVDGDDVLFGGPGSEFVLLGGSGNDLIAGGPGEFDLASWELSPVGVVVDLNNPAPQDTHEGLDTVIEVEGAVGSEFNDVLTGQNLPTATGNGLFGLNGTDQISGMDGNDVIDGGPGNDEGGPGIGLLSGGTGDDFLDGFDGDDDVYGDAGNDVLFGGDFAQTAGDFGDGGSETDECYQFEQPPVNCEPTTPPRASRAARTWLDAGTWLDARRELPPARTR